MHQRRGELLIMPCSAVPCGRFICMLCVAVRRGLRTAVLHARQRAAMPAVYLSGADLLRGLLRTSLRAGAIRQRPDVAGGLLLHVDPGQGPPPRRAGAVLGRAITERRVRSVAGQDRGTGHRFAAGTAPSATAASITNRAEF